jgi:hypothetical protein
VRLSACHYNTSDEIDMFLSATASLAKLRSEDVPPGGAQEFSGIHSEG